MVKSFYFSHSCHYLCNNFQYPNAAIVSTCSAGEMNCTKDEVYQKHPTRNPARIVLGCGPCINVVKTNNICVAQ